MATATAGFVGVFIVYKLNQNQQKPRSNANLRRFSCPEYVGSFAVCITLKVLTVADNKSSSLTSQVVSGLLVAAVVGVLSFVPDAFKWVAAVVSGFWSHLLGISAFPNWSLYLLALMSIHTLAYWIIRVTKPKGPSVTSYNHDDFLGLKWRWSYVSGRPFGAWAFCPHCDTQLVYSNVGGMFDPDRKTVLTCETCSREMLHHDGDKDYLVEKIHRQVDRKIRTGEWQKNVSELHP